MKLRIRGNSLRLRLTRSEVDRFKTQGRVDDAISFGPNDEERLAYSLVAWESAHAVSARFHQNTITVIVPTSIAQQWTGSEDVGFSAEQSVPGSEPLSLLVEKDFQCLHERPGEDESDAYPNPALDSTD